MRLLVDMNLTPRWAAFLTKAGHDASLWSSIGEPGASDDEICQYARQHGLALITNDLDFPQILAYTRESAPSVIILRGEPLTPESRGESILRALRDCESELVRGAILSLDWSGRHRARLLPL